jgi:hypothetical protein
VPNDAIKMMPSATLDAALTPRSCDADVSQGSIVAAPASLNL